mgnify:CR=1 FL=1
MTKNKIDVYQWLQNKEISNNIPNSMENIVGALQRSERILAKSSLVQNEDVVNVLKYSTDLSNSVMMLAQIIIECEKNGIFESETLQKFQPIALQIVNQYASSSNDSQ